jgi:hypothetical protein
VAKMNISIPDDLRQRMQPHDDALNWSRLATEAFGRAVANAELLASIKSDVKRRLQQTEIEDVGGLEKAAHRDGQRWATNSARMTELRRLENADTRDVDFDTWNAVVRVILGDRYEEDRADWFGPDSPFGATEDDTYEEQCAKAFVEGALEVLEEIDRSE